LTLFATEEDAMNKDQKTGPAQPDHIEQPETAKQVWRDKDGRPHLTKELEDEAAEAHSMRDERPEVPDSWTRSPPD
jgi:hypothetical protein